MRLNLSETRKVTVELTGKASITVTLLSTEETLALRRRHMNYKIVMGEAIEVLDQRAYAEDLWDSTIVSWAGMDDQDGKALPCNRQNKYALVSNYPEIALKINDAVATARMKTFEAAAALEKN